jgi:hypothetical protein
MFDKGPSSEITTFFYLGNIHGQKASGFLWILAKQDFDTRHQPGSTTVVRTDSGMTGFLLQRIHYELPFTRYKIDRLDGLVVSVPGYRFRGVGFYSQRH